MAGWKRLLVVVCELAEAASAACALVTRFVTHIMCNAYSVYANYGTRQLKIGFPKLHTERQSRLCIHFCKILYDYIV